MQKINNLLNTLKTNIVVKNSLFNISGYGIPLVLVFLATPVIVINMGDEAYGLWTIATSFLGFMGVFEFGVGNALVKFISEYIAREDKIRVNAVITAGFLLYFALGIIVTLSLFVFSDNIALLISSDTLLNGEISALIRIVSLGFFPLLLRNLSIAIPKGLQLFQYSSFLILFNSTMTIILALVVTLRGGNVITVTISTVLNMWGTALIGLTQAYFLLKRSQYGFSFQFSKSQFIKIFDFVKYAGITGLGWQIFSWMDKIVVGATLNLSAVTYYTLAINLANKFLLISDTLTQSLMPAASKWVSSKNYTTLTRYFKKATLGIAFMNLILLGFALVFSELFLTWWLGADLAYHVLFPFRILAIIYAIMSITDPAYHIVNGLGHPYVNAISTIGGGIGTIVAIVFLSPIWGVTGAAAANIFSWLRFIPLIFTIRYLNRVKNEPYH